VYTDVGISLLKSEEVDKVESAISTHILTLTWNHGRSRILIAVPEDFWSIKQHRHCMIDKAELRRKIGRKKQQPITDPASVNTAPTPAVP
jgi:hypothetical protein